MVCTVPEVSVSGMVACWPEAVIVTGWLPGETAVYGVTELNASWLLRPAEP